MPRGSYSWLQGCAPEESSLFALAHLFVGQFRKFKDHQEALQKISNSSVYPRLEVFRYLMNVPEFSANNLDFYALFADQMMRIKVFAGRKSPRVDMFCVGAPRSGTTTLSILLGGNKSVFNSAIKEPNYFSHLSLECSPNGVGIEFYEM